VQIGRHQLNVVSIYGVTNLDRVLEEIRHGVRYHFVEVMNCPYGCVGGPGQPLPASEEKYRARAHGLRKAADRKPGKCPLGRMGVHSIYEALGIHPGSREAQELFFFHKTNI
jgi:iron only hydrogenase large subunit-like protein